MKLPGAIEVFVEVKIRVVRWEKKASIKGALEDAGFYATDRGASGDLYIDCDVAKALELLTILSEVIGAQTHDSLRASLTAALAPKDQTP